MTTWIFTYNHKPTRTTTFQTRCKSNKNRMALGDRGLLARDGRVFAEVIIVDINTWDNFVVEFAGVTPVDYEVPPCANEQGRPFGPICKVK